MHSEQNPPEDWTLLDVRKSVVGQTYWYNSKLKPTYVLAVQVRKAHPGTLPRNRKVAVVLYRGMGTPRDPPHLEKVVDMQEVWRSRLPVYKANLLSAAKYRAMEWAEGIMFSGDEYLHKKLKQKRRALPNPEDIPALQVAQQLDKAKTLLKAQKLYVWLGEKLGRPGYDRPAYGSWTAYRKKGEPPAKERFITRKEAMALAKPLPASEEEQYQNKDWRRVAVKARRALEQRWGDSVRVTRGWLDDYHPKRKEKAPGITPEEKRLIEIARTTSYSAEEVKGLEES